METRGVAGEGHENLMLARVIYVTGSARASAGTISLFPFGVTWPIAEVA